MKVSRTWSRLTEAERDSFRTGLRKLVGDSLQDMPRMTPADQAVVRCMDALLMADRIEAGLAIGCLMGLEMFGASDAAFELLTKLYDRIDPLCSADPRRN